MIVGASLGGLAALTLEGTVPSARALVLVDIVPRGRPEGSARVKEFMTRNLHGFDSLADVGKAIAEYQGRLGVPRTESLRRNVRLRDGRWHWHWDPRIIEPANAPRGGASDTEHLLEAAARVRVPVLVVRGLLSDMVDEAGVDELCSVLRSATVVNVPEAGHMVAGNDNDAFSDSVREFLSALASGAETDRVLRVAKDAQPH